MKHIALALALLLSACSDGVVTSGVLQRAESRCANNGGVAAIQKVRTYTHGLKKADIGCRNGAWFLDEALKE